jgi:hypothetical protein
LSWRVHGGSTEEAPTYAGAARARAPTAPRRCGPCLRSDVARRRVVQGPPCRQWPRKEEGRGIHGQIHHGPTRTWHGTCGSCIFWIHLPKLRCESANCGRSARGSLFWTCLVIGARKRLREPSREPYQTIPIWKNRTPVSGWRGVFHVHELTKLFLPLRRVFTLNSLQRVDQ